MQGRTTTTRHGVARKKKYKKIKAYRKSLQKEPTVNRCLLLLDLKPFRLQAELQKIRACVRYNQKKAGKSSKRASLWIFTPQFFNFKALRRLYHFTRQVFQEFLIEFISQKGQCVRVPHRISDCKKPRQVKGKHSIGRESQSLAVGGKKLLTQTFL